MEYLTTATVDDQWELNFRRPEALRGVEFFPVASPDERIYSHPSTRCLYRAGERRIDVLHPHDTSWSLSCGEDNNWLTDLTHRYRCVSHTFQPDLEVA